MAEPAPSETTTALSTEPVYMGLPSEAVLRPRFYLALALTLPVFALAMGPMIPGLDLDSWINPHLSPWIQFILTTPVFFWCGWFFIRRFVRSTLERDTNMFTLIIPGIGAAYFYSAFAVIFPDWLPDALADDGHPPLYFEATAMIVTIVLIGQILEQRTHARTEEAIRSLVQLAPRTATRIAANGAEEDVAIDRILRGDRLRVRPGETVPVDGTIEEGGSALDESMITGESVPIDKSRGDPVLGGTGNTQGAFIMRAERVGSETILARIIELVKTAQETEPPIQRLADRVSGIFVPVVLAISVLTFITWYAIGPEPSFTYALVNAVAVLVIACPCALGLATPVSIVTGIGRGAQAGILVRDAEALERLQSVNTILLDKTGTLTEGRPGVDSLHPVNGISEETLLSAAAAAELGSEHPLARALVREARNRDLQLTPADQFEAVTGGGVRATTGPDSARVGRPDFVINDAGVDPGQAAALIDTIDPAGKTIILVARNHELLGAIALTDRIRETAESAVRELHRLGIRVGMVTGDNQGTADAVARALGIDLVHANVRPEDKQRIVREHAERGELTAFCGDGINDAPALAAAHVGIAMGTGTDVAIDSAGLILVKGDLQALVRAVHLSRAVLRNIKQNLFFAFCYNSLGIPVAAGLLYPIHGILLNPMIAGVAMALSSISVVSNALRLKSLKL
ncbi:MAG: copper-translocating P-type ATPase [Opitutaceae bacterium]